MASKKLKTAAKVAAGIGAAYLASKALKEPKEKDPFSLVRRKGDTFGADTAQAYAASKPKDTFASDMAVDPIGILYNPMSSNEGFGPMAKEGKFIKASKGTMVLAKTKLGRTKPTKLY